MVKGTYILIVTLNIMDYVLQPKGTDWLIDTKTKPMYILSTRDPLQTQGCIQTEDEGIEKENIPRKQRSKESWNINTYIRQNVL